MKIKFGADPELFLKLGDQYVSAYGILPGNKKNPHKVEKGAVQVDGLAFEFNIDPAETEDEFVGNIATVLTQMDEMVKAVDKDMTLEFIPYAKFDPEYFKLLPYDCKILGCDPDYECVKGGQKEPPSGLENRPFRTTSGHIHIGWTEGENPHDPGHFEDARFVAKKLYDRNVLRPRTKEEYARLDWYGDRGAFRPKSYGMEYRAPSNLWVKDEAGRRDAFRQVKSVMDSLGA